MFLNKEVHRGMKKSYRIALISTCFSLSTFITSAFAQSIAIKDGFVRESIPGTTVSSAYMSISNTSDKAVTLIGASSKVSPRVEIHEHTMADGLMQMRQKESIVVNSKETVILQPSGLHLMIFDVTQPLVHGEKVELTLQFSSHPDVVITLPVQSIKKQHHH